MFIKNKSGFTLTELLISLGMFGLIFSLIMQLYISDYKSYKYIRNDTELQFQAQYILNFMSDKIVDSKGIARIEYQLSGLLKKTSEQKITRISFKYGNSNKCYNFDIKYNKIFYGNNIASAEANAELGAYVSEMFICPVPMGVSFENAKAIKIRLKLKKEKQSYEVEQSVYMRNN